MTTLLHHMDWLNGRVPDEVRVQLRQLVEVVGYLPYPQPLGVLTADAVLLAANRPLLDLLGASGDELLGADWDAFMPGWSERSGGAGVTGGGAPHTLAFEDYLVTHCGDPVWVCAVASPILTPSPSDAGTGPPEVGADEALAAWALFVVDVTPRDEGGEDARRQEILDLLLESPSEFVVRLDGEGRVAFLSPSLMRLLGGSPGLEGNDVKIAHGMAAPDFEREVGALFDELARPPYRAEREMAMATPTGRRVVHWVFESLLADGGDLRSVLGVGRDVTERKEAETAVRRRLDLEITVSSISTRFVNATRETLPAVIDYALAEVGRHIGADRMSLFELGPDGVSARAARFWRRDIDRVTEVPKVPGVPDVPHLDWLRGRLAAGDPVAVASVDDLPEEAAAERAAFEQLGVCSVLLVPIAQEGRMVGYLALGQESEGAKGSGTERRGWDDDDLYLLRLLADQLAGLLVSQADDHNLRSVSDAFLAFGPDVTANLTQVCRAAAEITGAGFALYSRRRGADLVVEAGWNAPEDLPRVTPAAGRACADVMARPDDAVHVIRELDETVYAHTSPLVRGFGLRTYVGFPVVVEGRAVASLSCLFTTDAALRESQLELLRVLGRAAAVEEVRRGAMEERLLDLAQLEQAMERTVETLSGAMSTRDPYTAGHARRVAQLVAAIGSELEMGADDLRLLRLAASVHDIGKIAVPSEILSKPARLSEAEFAIIKCHSENGHELLAPAGLPGAVTDAVLQHHERLDGSGYPAGLTGDGISEFARIVAVADVVEAMASHRPYRPAVGLEPALAEIEEGRGVRYDDRVADACVRLFRDKGFAFAD